MYFYNIDQMLYKRKREGVQIKVISGENVQMQFAKLEPGFVSDHSHPHEQMGQVISGELELTIAGEKKIPVTCNRDCGPRCPNSYMRLST